MVHFVGLDVSVKGADEEGTLQRLKALRAEPLKRDIIPFIAWTRPPQESRMAIHIARREFIGSVEGVV
jgi:hypothetical protein